MTTQEKLAACLAKAKLFTPENIVECSRESGWHPDALRALSRICKNEKKLRIYRKRKWEAIQYEGRPGYRAKPMAVKLKSQSDGPYVALVIVPQKLDTLPPEAQGQVKALLANGYRLQPTRKNDELMYLVDSNGNKFYSDIDPMGTYLQVSSGVRRRRPGQLLEEKPRWPVRDASRPCGEGKTSRQVQRCNHHGDGRYGASSRASAEAG